MGERIARDSASLDLRDHLPIERFLDGREERLLVETRHAEQYIEVELAPEHGPQGERLIAGVRQARKPTPDHISHAFGNPDAIDTRAGGPRPVSLLEGSGLSEVRKHGAGEEGIALGFAMDCLGELSRLGTEGDSLGHGLDERENFLDR